MEIFPLNDGFTAINSVAAMSQSGRVGSVAPAATANAYSPTLCRQS
jgi:hypothetical protein